MSKRDPRAIVSIVLGIFGFLLAQIFGALGFSLIGAGHGSGLLGYLFFSPVIGGKGSYVYLGLIIWPIIGCLLPWARNLLVTGVIILLLGCQYYAATNDIMADLADAGTTSYIKKVAKELPDLVFLIISVYALMQLAVASTLVYLHISKPRKQ